MNVYFVTAESSTWFNQMAHILLSINSPGVSREEVLANLPSVDIVIQQAMTHDEYSQTQALLGIMMSLFLAVAAVCEKYQEYERALPYLDAALSTDLTRAGNHLPISRVQHSLLKGRVLAALGRKAEAAETLERTAEEAHRYGIRMCEVFALRDLKLGVLDDLGHGEHASRRLGAVLRLLKGPAEKLTELLKGLDAGALMALPPPDPSYRVVYEVDSSDTALRRELEGLKLKELRKRARDADVDSSQLEDAADDDDPKSAVIELLLISLKSTAVDQDGEAALQTELEGLRLKELRGRAKAAGIDSSLLEDAADDDDPKSAVIQLIIGLHKNAGSLSPLAEGEAGIIDHLSNGNASEIGSRGRAGAAVPAESTTVGLEPEPWTDDGNSETEAALVEELRGLKLLTLRARGLDASIASDIVDDATDSDDPKSALIALLVMHAGASAGSAATAAAGGGGGAGSPPKDDQPTGGGKHRRAELEGMGVMALHKLAVSGGIDVMSDLKDAMGE